jgi:DNA-binding NarL/FixJ family response regulator
MTILFVDDQLIFRKSFTHLLKTIIVPSPTCIEAENGNVAIQKLQSTPVDMVFLDINMPDMNGIETCKVLCATYPTLPIIVLTSHDNSSLILQLHQMGIRSFLTKTVELEELKKAVELVMKGEKYFPKEIESILNNAIEEEKINSQRIHLTPQEKSLLKLLVQGKTSKEIAQEMNITLKSVSTYRERLLQKTQTANVAQLVSFGFRTGLLN